MFRGIRSPAWKQQIHRQAATPTQHFSRVLGIGTQACIAELKPNPHWLPVLRYRLCVDLALTWPLPVLHRHPRGDAGRAARSLEHTILSGCSIAAAARSQEECRPYLPQCLPLAKLPPATESLVGRVRSLPITSAGSLILEVTLISHPSLSRLWLASSLPGIARSIPTWWTGRVGRDLLAPCSTGHLVPCASWLGVSDPDGTRLPL